MKRTALAVAVGLMGVSALPAAAHPTGPNTNHPTGSSCTARTVAYVVHGTYVSSNLQPGPTPGVYIGTMLVLTETSANHHAKMAQSPFTAVKTPDMTFDAPDDSIAGAHVTVSDEVVTAGGPTVGDRVTVKGTITVQHKNCVGDFTQEVVIKRVVVTPPAQTS